MAKPYCLVVVLLLAEVSKFGEGASNPGFVARITRKGLDYACRYGVATLKKKLSTNELPTFLGTFETDWFGSVSYEFYRLRIYHFELQNSNLSLLPGQGVRASFSNNSLSVSGNWKIKKAFINLKGTFDLKVDGIFISVSLNLGKDFSGRPTVSVANCSSHIDHVSIDISGYLNGILNFFREIIEKEFKQIMQQKICEMVKQSTTSYLKPYLQTLPVTFMIDNVAGINYSLVEAPQVTSQGLDIPFKGEFFTRSWHAPVLFDAPAIKLPQEHDRMVYFAVSEYVFNTASHVYHQAGRMNFTLRNEHLGRLFPNMEMELETSPESAPILMLTPGNVTLKPVMNIQAFALLPNSKERKALFQLRARTNISATINVTSSRISGSLTTGSKLKLELKHSNVGFFNVLYDPFALVPPLIQVQLMEAVLNYYTLHIIYPTLNAKLEEGFPLPLPRNTSLNSLVLQVHKNFLFLGANID